MAIYFKDRIEAGRQLLANLKKTGPDNAVICITAEAAVVANQIAQALNCPLQLYLEETISVPGGLEIGSVDQQGHFQYASNLSEGHQQYFYQEFRGYIEDTKRDSFSHLNRELKGRETMRNDLLAKRDLYVVTDCLESLVPLNSFVKSVKTVDYKSITVCAPIAMSGDLSEIERMSNEHNILGTIDFFFGADHYFEDNTSMPRDKVIQVISDTLKLWPVA